MAVASHDGLPKEASSCPQPASPEVPETADESAEIGLLDEAEMTAEAFLSQFDDTNGVVRTVRLVGGAMITILLVTVVLNEIFNSVNVGSGPFSGVGTDLTSTGVTAMGLLVLGLLVVAANRIIGIFGGGGGM